MRKGCQKDPPHVARFVRSFSGAALLTTGALFRREYALVDRAGLLDKAGPFEVTLRDKLHNFTHFALQGGKFEKNARPITASNNWFQVARIGRPVPIISSFF
jgi:hypothetical protein